MSDFDNELFVKRLNEAIGEDSVADFAKKVGMTEEDANNILSGKTEAKSRITVRISSAYHVSLDWLLGLSEEKNPAEDKDEQMLKAWIGE